MADDEAPAGDGDWLGASETAGVLGIPVWSVNCRRLLGQFPGARKTRNGWVYSPATVRELADLSLPPGARPSDDPLPGLVPESMAAENEVDKSKLLEEEARRRGPIVRMVNYLLTHAMDRGACGLSLMSNSEVLAVREEFVGDSEPDEAHPLFALLASANGEESATSRRFPESFPIHLTQPLADRFALMADIDLNQKHRAQSGHIGVTHNDVRWSIRAQIVPTAHGPAVFLRFHLEARADRTAIELSDDLCERVFSTLERGGIVAVAAAPGNGATTTAAALLKDYLAREKAVVTIESPIEYPLPGAAQIVLSPADGVALGAGDAVAQFETRSSAMSAALRMTCDVLFIGRCADEIDRAAIERAHRAGIGVLTTVAAKSVESARHVLALADDIAESVLIVHQKLVRDETGVRAVFESPAR